MSTSLGTVSWGSAPTISIALSYDYSRSGADMIYNVHVSVQPVTGAHYFGYPIYVSVTMDGASHGSGTIKAASPSQWGSAITWSTGSQTISGKTSGTTALKVRIYSGSGSSRDTTYSYSMAVSPAGSTISTGNGTLGTSQTITITKQNATFTDTITYTCGTASGTIVTDTLNNSVSWTPPITLASQNTTGTSVSITLKTTTKSSGVTVQSMSITITCDIPASVKPSCTLAISDPTGYATTYGAYVQSKSTLRAVISATTSYGSPINTYKLTADGNIYTTQTTTTPVLQNTGAQTVSATVTDKRGRVSDTATQSYSVLAYSQPKTTAFSLYRCDDDGTQNPEGHNMRVAFTGEVTALNNNNSAAYHIRYRVTGTSTWTYITCSELAGLYAGSCTPRIIAAADANAYDVQIRITDDFGTVTAARGQIPIAYTIMNWRTDGDGMAIGGINTQAGLQVYMPTEFYDDVDVAGDLTISGSPVLAEASSVQSVTATLSKTSGTWDASSVTVRKFGKVVHMVVVLAGTGTSVNAGSNAFVGSISGISPIISTSLIGYLSSFAVVAQLAADGTLTVRLTGSGTSTLGSGSTVTIRGAFIAG